MLKYPITIELYLKIAALLRFENKAFACTAVTYRLPCSKYLHIPSLQSISRTVSSNMLQNITWWIQVNHKYVIN